ncbi:MAG: response regulator [Wenzhouxiangellaceae bacterium]|nr:response regulator [Wenzhouxiangellaceae bacterium]
MGNHQPVALDALRILAVDDHAINRDFLRAVLGPGVAGLTLAGSGHEAIDACRREAFDIVLMDLHMPDMDGADAWCRIMRDLEPEAAPRVIALTADSRPEERQRLRALGFHGFLAKPVSADLLRTTVVRVANGGDGFAEEPGQSPKRALLLDDARARRANGSEKRVSEMRAAVAAEIERCLPELHRLLIEARHSAAAELLHQWKGACGYAGATRLEQACRQLEQSLSHDLDSSPGTLLFNLQRTAESTSQAIERGLGARG